MSGSSTVTSLRLSEEEVATFKAAAAAAGLSLNAWLVRAGLGTAQLEAALAALEARRSQPVPFRGDS